MYKKAHEKARVKTHATDGRDQFGSENAVTSGAGGNVRFAGNEHMGETLTEYDSGLEALNGYFDKLYAATTNEKAVLAKLVANNKKLMVANEEIIIVIKKLTGENKQL